MNCQLCEKVFETMNDYDSHIRNGDHESKNPHSFHGVSPKVTTIKTTSLADMFRDDMIQGIRDSLPRPEVVKIVDQDKFNTVIHIETAGKVHFTIEIKKTI